MLSLPDPCALSIIGMPIGAFPVTAPSPHERAAQLVARIVMRAKLDPRSASEVIARLRKALDLPTNTQLAAWLGTDTRTVSHWKKRNGVPCKAVIRVSDATGTTLDWLLLGREASSRANMSGPNEKTLKIKFLVGARVYIDGDRSLTTAVTCVVWRGEHVEYDVGWLTNGCHQYGRFAEWRLTRVDEVSP